MRSILPFVCLLGALALLASPAAAQLGRQTWGPINLDGATTNNGHLGVQFLNGSYYVSSRGLGAAPPHKVYIFDSAGNLTGNWNQTVLGPSAGSWGYRDGATDGQVLMFGKEGIIAVVNPADGTAANTIQTAGGPVNVGSPQWAANPIVIPGALGTARALEYDPAGNNNQGSFYSANFGSPIYEIDLNGNTIRTIPLPTPPNVQWSAYGFAFDLIKNTPNQKWLWVNSAPNQGPIRAIDLSTGQIVANVSITSRPAGYAAQGGLTGVPGGAGGSGNFFDLVALQQGTPDVLVGHRVHQYSGCNGTEEPWLVSAVNGVPATPDRTNKTFMNGDTLTWGYDLTLAPALNGNPAILIANLFADANSTATTPIISEFVNLHFLSTPPGAVPIVLGDGVGIGVFLGYLAPIGPHQLGAPNQNLVLPASPIFAPGDKIRMQAIYFRAGCGPTFLASNTVLYTAQ